MDSQTPWDTNEEQKIQEIYKESATATDTKNNKHTVIKYTKIPEYDQSLNLWCERSQVRIRNYVTIDNQSDVKMSQSFTQDILPHVPNHTRRKVVRIEESDHDETCRTKSDSKRSTFSTASKYIAKSNATKRNTNTRSNNKKESTSSVFRTPHLDSAKIFHVTRRVKSPLKIKTSCNSVTTKSRGKKPCLKSIDSNQELIIIDSPNIKRYSKEKSLKHIHNKILGLNLNKTSDIIYVPIEHTEHKEYMKSTVKNVSTVEAPISNEKSILFEQIYDSAKNNLNDVQIETYPEAVTDKDTNTCIDNLNFDHRTRTIVNNEKNNDEMRINIKRESVEFGSLCIPRISLIEKNDQNNFASVSLPNLYVPHVKKSYKGNQEQSECYKIPSYIISRATLTYTTKQKIDFRVVTNNEENENPPKFVASYPMNVVSIYKENKNKERQSFNFISKKNVVQRDINQNIKTEKHVNASSYLGLIKPSEVINTLKLDNSFIQSEWFCDQFQKELNFIDSFFDSLQYLENNSLADKIFRKSITVCEDKLSLTKLHEFNASVCSEQALANLNSNVAKASSEDVEKVASKSLCLLNMLIRNEQRRAKNLLFVLKLRQEALKDFTKSQILWLESKKKFENTDVSALKKKQRGALLKLQHECGEMQRIRKALLTLSEKRRSVLLKTKKNIEQKVNQVDMKNEVNRRKKLKRNPTLEHMIPLKCFDLSSSAEDTSSSKSFSEMTIPSSSHNVKSPLKPYSEKCVQTSSEQRITLKDKTSDTSNHIFVKVDGSYLNILLHNLTLPEIFSCGRDYEVNKDALKNVIQSANSLRDTVISECTNKNLMSQIKGSEKSKSTSPSTARSLVEEFDQYYKRYEDQDYKDSSSERNTHSVALYSSTPKEEHEVEDSLVQTVVEEGKEHVCGNFDNSFEVSISDKGKTSKTEVLKIDDESNTNKTCLNHDVNSAVEVPLIEEISSQVQLPNEYKLNDKLVVDTDGIISETVECKDCKPLSAARQVSVSPEDMADANEPSKQTKPFVVSTEITSASEAEELMRQQIAIEREIKALEQQQSQFLVVREIPDKPPPPYTPPVDSRFGNCPPKAFKPDADLQKIVAEHFDTPKDASRESTKVLNGVDPFVGLVHNYCDEVIERMNVEKSDKPWHPYNLRPKRQEISPEQLQKKIVADLKQALSGPPPAVPGPVSRRGTDYIDDILFSELPRCESEWTNLQAEEALVKNQVFESIFEKILSETISDFKTMFSPEPPKEG